MRPVCWELGTLQVSVFARTSAAQLTTRALSGGGTGVVGSPPSAQAPRPPNSTRPISRKGFILLDRSPRERARLDQNIAILQCRAWLPSGNGARVLHLLSP